MKRRRRLARRWAIGYMVFGVTLVAMRVAAVLPGGEYRWHVGRTS